MAKKPILEGVDDLIGGDASVPKKTEMVKVRWMSHNRGTVDGRPRYKDDRFEMPRNLVNRYGKDIEII